MIGSFILGKPRINSGASRLIVYNGPGNGMIVGPPRKGKSRAFCMANLINGCNCSNFVVDWKGELAMSTAMWVSAMLGHEVWVFDPFGIVDQRFIPSVNGEPCYGRFNPIDTIRASRSPLSSALHLASSLIPVGSTSEPHWPKGAQLLLVAYILFVAFDASFEDQPQRRNLDTVWELLTNKKLGKEAMKLMLLSDNPNVRDQALALKKAGKDSREQAGIRNHLRVACTPILGEPQIIKVLQDSATPFGEMNRRPITVYVVVPGEFSDVQSGFVKLLISTALGEIERAGLRQHDSTMGPINWWLDEFATLNRFDQVKEAMGRMPGYGCRFIPLVQTLSQLQVYGNEWTTFLGTSSFISCFGGTVDTLTAKTISELCGTETIVVTNPGESQNNNGGGTSTSDSKQSRPLIMPDEVMRLPMPRQIIIRAGQNPMVEHILDPGLGDFPDYLAFQYCIEQGHGVEFAKEMAAKYRLQPVVNDNRNIANDNRRVSPPKVSRRMSAGSIIRNIFAQDVGD